MTTHRLDVLAIGNAIVDVIADASDEFVASQGVPKGSMRLIDEAEATRLYEAMGPAREASGGSAANTVAGISALGLRAGFIGQLGDDQLGEIFTHDIRSLGVEFDTPPRGDVGATARCLILVTPDAQRTMNTFLAPRRCSGRVPSIRRTSPVPRRSTSKAIVGPGSGAGGDACGDGRGARGRNDNAFTLSDSFVVSRHRDDLLRLLEDGRIDILFANEAEILMLAGSDDLETALQSVAPKVQTLVVTRSEQGALALSGGERAQVAAEPIEQLVDTTGAGDLFAAGFLAGRARGLGLEQSLKLGAIAAAEVIQHYGARPEADLKKLAGELLT